jgi:ATP-dependent DNA helicase RecG
VDDALPKWASNEISVRLHTVRQVGENAAVDFKETFPDQAHRLGKEIAAMASSGGGRIYIGINDNGELCGITANNGDERDDIVERAHSIARTVKPVPRINLHFAVESTYTVLVLDIPKQDHPVFYYESRPYVRDQRRARPAEPQEVVELVWAHPSSEHKLEMERIHQQQTRDFIEANRERQRNCDESMKSLHRSMVQ